MHWAPKFEFDTRRYLKSFRELLQDATSLKRETWLYISRHHVSNDTMRARSAPDEYSKSMTSCAAIGNYSLLLDSYKVISRKYAFERVWPLEIKPEIKKYWWFIAYTTGILLESDLTKLEIIWSALEAITWRNKVLLQRAKSDQTVQVAVIQETEHRRP